MSFIIDCLDRNISLREISMKHNIPMDCIFDVYEEKRKLYNYTEIQNIMREVYYCDED